MGNQQANTHIGETQGMRDHDHDLIHELSTRLDAVWRYDQYIANAERENALQARQLWQDVKEQDLKTVERLKELIREHVRKNDF
jgi:hypothetical protein